MRRYGKVDANHPGIVRELRQLGYSVLSTADLGEGVFDLLVGSFAGRGVNLAVEVKDPNQPPSKRRLTDDEKKFHTQWRGPILVAETTEDIVRKIKELQ